jgi:hypothetical protein
MTVASYIEFKDYFKVSTVNKRLNEELRATIGAKSLLFYFKSYTINRQPLCTVNVRYPPQHNGPLLDLTHFEQNVIGGASSIHGYDDRSSVFNNSIMSQTYDRINQPQVSQADIDKYQSNEQVKYCIKRYVCDEYKAGSQSEKSLKKASEMVFSYAKVVYTDEQLEQMRVELLKSQGMLNMGEPTGNQSN